MDDEQKQPDRRRYHIVVAKSSAELERMVDDMIRDDDTWQTSGGLAIVDRREAITFYQAMTRRPAKKPETKVAFGASNGNSVKK